jgi:hypothetical protein
MRNLKQHLIVLIALLAAFAVNAGPKVLIVVEKDYYDNCRIDRKRPVNPVLRMAQAAAIFSLQPSTGAAGTGRAACWWMQAVA